MSKRKANWIARMLSEGDGTPSTKRVCFFIASNAAVGLCFGLFFRHGNEALAVDLMKWTLTAAGTAYGITRFAEFGPPKSEAQNAPVSADDPRATP
jgi:hypothetical protein